MLSKEICKKCINSEDKWDKYDEKNWKKFCEVICLIGHEGRPDNISIKEEPPENCPFTLEHIMETQ